MANFLRTRDNALPGFWEFGSDSIVARTQLDIHPEIFAWARQRRGFNVAEAAKKLNMSVDRLVQLETGTERPSPAKLREAALLYRVSPAIFFLSEVPDVGFVPPQDFRTVGSGEIPGFSPDLREEIDRVRAQQAVLRDLARLGSFEPRPIEPPDLRSNDVELIAQNLRTWLRIEDFLLSERSKPMVILGAWIDAVEHRGVYVSQVSGIPVAEMRGFCLPDPHFPMIVINGADSPAGRLFTLLHELIHVLSGEEGICNNPLTLRTSESRCNSIAAAMLMPRRDVLDHQLVKMSNQSSVWSIRDLDTVAKEFGSSAEAVVRRLLTLERTTEAQYRRIRKLLYQRWTASQRPSGNGPDHDALLLRNLGREYVRRVISARNQRLITHATVASFIFAKVRWARAMADRLELPYV